jgi:hypothetical protein
MTAIFRNAVVAVSCVVIADAITLAGELLARVAAPIL